MIIGQSRASGISAEAAAFLARTSGLDATHTNAYITLINGLVADGTWALLDALWVPATQDSTTALLNLLSASFALTLVNSPTFTANQGFAGNGTSSYMNTNFVPSTNGVQYTLNSASYGVYDRTSRLVDSGEQMSVISDSLANISKMSVWIDTDNRDMRINESIATSTTASATGGASAGFYAAVRTGATAAAIFKNGSSIATGTGAATAKPTVSFFIDARNNEGVAGNFSSDQIAIAFVGSGSINQSSFYTRLQAYMTTLGTQV